MMPLTLANTDEDNTIRHIGGSNEVRRHLENLGFVAGGNVKIVSRVGNNVIVVVKETRIALDEKLAQKIMI